MKDTIVKPLAAKHLRHELTYCEHLDQGKIVWKVMKKIMDEEVEIFEEKINLADWKGYMALIARFNEKLEKRLEDKNEAITV